MKPASLFCLAVLLAVSAFAQLTPGVVVQHGQRFPLVADFNGDGLDDLFAGRSVVINNGTSFGDAFDLGIGTYEEIIGLPDVNGDHIPDLLTFSGPLDNTYRLYIADAARHYGTPVVVSTTLRPYIADADGDGKDDFLFLAPVHAATDVTVLRSRGDGTFDRLSPFRIPPQPQLERPRLETGDLDHDGIPDIVVRCTPDLAILHGLGGGKFAVESRYMPMVNNFPPKPSNAWGSWNTRLADIDGDHNLDVVTVGQRMIHVLFGDGRGNFPRAASAKVEQLHPVTGTGWLPIDPQKIQQPRDIAVGHFTRGDRNEIAADTLEGDLVVFAVENGTLAEVSRTQTGFPFLDLRTGNFRGSELTDVCAYTSLDSAEATPPPQLFYGTEDEVRANAVSRTAGRHRAAAASHAPAKSMIRLLAHTECLPDSAQDFVFSRDGVFGHGATADALFDGDTVYVRAPVPGFAEPVEIVLTRNSDGVYSYTRPYAECAGALQSITFTATVK